MKKILDLEIFAKRSPNYPKTRHFDIFLKNGSNDFFCFWPEVRTKYDLQFEWNLFFRKKMQFGDIWPRNCQKIAQIEVFGHFLNFTVFVFLDFPHNGRCTWCLVVFLQFAGPVNVFLLFYVINKRHCFYKSLLLPWDSFQPPCCYFFWNKCFERSRYVIYVYNNCSFGVYTWKVFLTTFFF